MILVRGMKVLLPHKFKSMNESPYKFLWTYEEAAQSLSLSVQALRDLIYKGRGPKYVNIGRRVFFKPKDIEDFVNGLTNRTHL